LLNFHQRSIPEDSNLQNRFRDNPTPWLLFPIILTKTIQLPLIQRKYTGLVNIPTIIFYEPGSSVTVDYGLDDRATVARSPAEAKDFSFSLCVQISSEAHPASYPMGSFHGCKARQGVTLTTHPHLLPRSELYLLCLCRLHGGSGTALLHKENKWAYLIFVQLYFHFMNERT
jgi:hypothetical protein